jgi:RNA polymerase sigma-70 factor (ECF subfamily)
MIPTMRRDGRPPRVSTPGEAVEDILRASEPELIRRCLLGERAAFERFYREHARAVAANLYRVLGDRGELDDLVQEVFLIAFRGMPRFRGDAKLSTWLYRICVNVALGRLRSRARRPPPVPYADALEEVACAALSADERLAQQQELARVYRALEGLAPKKRVVFVLHEIEELDIAEIADIVGAPQVTVRTRLHYARKEFYRRIAEEAP